MNSFKSFRIFYLLLAIVFVFVYAPQAKAELLVELIKDILPIITIVLMVLAVVVIAVAAGALVAQLGLTYASAIFTTLAGTAIVGATMVGAGLWAADCLFDGSEIDPNIICTGKDVGGTGTEAGSSILQVDVRIDGSNGPVNFDTAPVDFNIDWAISGADQSTACEATGDWSGDIENATGQSEITGVGQGTYDYGVSCVKGGNTVSDSVVVIVNDLPVCTFSASPIQIVLPAATVLSWNCQNADSCQISNGATRSVSTSGSLEVRPEQNTTYILACKNNNGSVTSTVTIGVLEPYVHEVNPSGGD